MSQRLIKPGLRHPHTGQLIAAIGYRRNGTPIWPVIGASEDDDAGGDDTPPDADDDADEEDDEDEDGKPTKSKKSSKTDDDDDEETVPKWKLDKAHTRMTAADRRASDLQKQLDELKASKDINPEVKKELDEIKAKLGPIEAERDALRIRVAFLGTNIPGVVWKNAEAALKLADLSEVEVDDKGNVDKRALKSALKTLAAEHPYLVADKADDADDKTDDKTPVTTSAKNGRRKGTKTAPDLAAQAKRFPVLNRG